VIVCRDPAKTGSFNSANGFLTLLAEAIGRKTADGRPLLAAAPLVAETCTYDYVPVLAVPAGNEDPFRGFCLVSDSGYTSSNIRGIRPRCSMFHAGMPFNKSSICHPTRLKLVAPC